MAQRISDVVTTLGSISPSDNPHPHLFVYFVCFVVQIPSTTTKDTKDTKGK